MAHHPSCRPNDRNLIYKCDQCGMEEPALPSEDYMRGYHESQNDLIDRGNKIRKAIYVLSNIKNVDYDGWNLLSDEVKKEIEDTIRELGGR